MHKISREQWAAANAPPDHLPGVEYFKRDGAWYETSVGGFVTKASEMVVPWCESVVRYHRNVAHGYVNTGPEHMPAGPADRKAHDHRLAERGERDES